VWFGDGRISCAQGPPRGKPLVAAVKTGHGKHDQNVVDARAAGVGQRKIKWGKVLAAGRVRIHQQAIHKQLPCQKIARLDVVVVGFEGVAVKQDIFEPGPCHRV